MAVDTDAARKQLTGPVHGTLQVIRGMCSDQLPHEEIDVKLAELDDLVYKAALQLACGRRRVAISIEVVHGETRMRPPLLLGQENPDGVLLEDLLEQLLSEMEAKQAALPSRETACVITNLEQALLWQLRRGMKRGTVMVEITDPRRVG